MSREIQPNEIAAAIDASGALGLAGSSQMIGALARSKSTRISISARLRGHSGNTFDVGPQWDVDLPARTDGSPCLNALADLGLFGEASALCHPGQAVADVTAHWGSHYLFHDSGDLQAIYPPRAAAVRRVMAMLAGVAA